MQAQRKPARPEAELLDNSYLASLEAALGRSVTRDVLADGLIEVSDRLDNLAALAQADRRIEVQQTAHDIAGGAGQLGLHALSVAARKLEQDLKAEPPAAMSPLVEGFLALRPVSLTALRVYLDHLS